MYILEMDGRPKCIDALWRDLSHPWSWGQWMFRWFWQRIHTACGTVQYDESLEQKQLPTITTRPTRGHSWNADWQIDWAECAFSIVHKYRRTTYCQAREWFFWGEWRSRLPRSSATKYLPSISYSVFILRTSPTLHPRCDCQDSSGKNGFDNAWHF